MEPAWETSAARMAKRSFRRVSAGLEGRSERPATWHGQADAAIDPLSRSMLILPGLPCLRQNHARRGQAKVAHPEPAGLLPAVRVRSQTTVRLPLGVARAMEPAWETSAARMAKHSFRRVSAGLEGRSERPATWHGQADAAIDPLRGSMLILPGLPCPRQNHARRGQAKVAHAEQAGLLPAVQVRSQTPVRIPLGVARAKEPAWETERSQDGEDRFPSSERRPGGPKRTSGNMARAAPSHGWP